ncbi:MAG: hypothetical protein HC929_24015 [Leptolyngbyaceae cyanobacterium SM2_5_2]|nr:hypothetical protein [Leptolyngbyaceae cyanobacterium SM2_5_2]
MDKFYRGGRGISQKGIYQPSRFFLQRGDGTGDGAIGRRHGVAGVGGEGIHVKLPGFGEGAGQPLAMRAGVAGDGDD